MRPFLLALLVSFPSLAACGNHQAATAECRKQFAAESQLLTDHGNPGNKQFTPKLAGRWDDVRSDVGRLSTSAAAEDCPGKLAAMKHRIARVESVLRKVEDYDVARMLASGEADLKKAEAKLGPLRRDYVLVATAKTMRESAAGAERSLAPFVARVDAVDPAKYSRLAPAMVALYDAAASDAAFADFKDALASIHDYEPPEK